MIKRFSILLLAAMITGAGCWAAATNCHEVLHKVFNHI